MKHFLHKKQKTSHFKKLVSAENISNNDGNKYQKMNLQKPPSKESLDHMTSF